LGAYTVLLIPGNSPLLAATVMVPAEHIAVCIVEVALITFLDFFRYYVILSAMSRIESTFHDPRFFIPCLQFIHLYGLNGALKIKSNG
ncbi:MAG: hypothetical protein RQ824_12425, partial [bacterium]|nr:hypothetical protein [bacterium]